MTAEPLDRGPARLFVWGVWAAMLGAALLLIGRYGRNVPYYDDWTLVPVLAGEQPVDVTWLWEPHNGHRIAVPKLALLGLHSITGWDFRTGMFASVFLLGLASFVLIRALSRSRGFYRYADAVFPLLFLNWGHYENLLWGWQLTQVLPIAVAAMLLAAIVRWKLDPPFRVAVLASFSLVTLPLSGGVGLPCTLGFALWLVAAGHRAWLRGTAKLKIHALIIWSISGLALILAAAYFRISLTYECPR